MAKLDPLGLDERTVPIELDPALYGFADKDLDRECALYPLMSFTAPNVAVVMIGMNAGGNLRSAMCCEG